VLLGFLMHILNCSLFYLLISHPFSLSILLLPPSLFHTLPLHFSGPVAPCSVGGGKPRCLPSPSADSQGC
jgi:hypothetical protein